MSRERMIIAFECIEKRDDFIFESAFFARVRKLAGEMPVLHLDTFSDSTLLSYAKKGIEDGSDTLLLVKNETSQNLKGLSALLTAATRSKLVLVLSAVANPVLEKIRNSRVWDDLGDGIQNWILNSSESF